MKLLTTFVGIGLCVSSVFAEGIPRSMSMDARVKVLTYSPNQVYKLVAYYGYQIDIELSPREEIKTIAAGDTIAWQIVNSGRHLFVKPMSAPARTNLSVITNQRTYVFDLTARATVDRDDITYLVRFKQSETALVSMGTPDKGAPRLNLDYKLAGSSSTRPLHVFDDGQFTYFKFDPEKELPAIFVVGGDGKESLVNYRIEGTYVVVERLGEFFTLRNGKESATALNEQRLKKPA